MGQGDQGLTVHEDRECSNYKFDSEAGDTSIRELDEDVSTEGTSSVELDLDSLTGAQVLAVQTRAQKRRQQQLEQADAEVTEAAGTVIHTLGTPTESSEAPREDHGDVDASAVEMTMKTTRTK